MTIGLEPGPFSLAASIFMDLGPHLELLTLIIKEHWDSLKVCSLAKEIFNNNEDFFIEGRIVHYGHS